MKNDASSRRYLKNMFKLDFNISSGTKNFTTNVLYKNICPKYYLLNYYSAKFNAYAMSLNKI